MVSYDLTLDHQDQSKTVGFKSINILYLSYTFPWTNFFVSTQLPKKKKKGEM